MSGRILVAGGGTAGHVFPALAVARRLSELGYEPTFIGVRDRLEDRLVPEAGFPLEHIEMIPVPRRPSADLLKLPFALRRAIRRCAVLIEDHGALTAVTFGGYVSFPLAWASARLGLPLVVHEQNSVPGLANRIAARRADAVAISFPASGDAFPRQERVRVTGNPVRPEIADLDVEAGRERALQRYDLDPARRTLLVFGGSQGARSLNRAAVASHDLWRNPGGMQVLHGAGRELHAETEEAWADAAARREGPLVRCVDFIEDMGDAYGVADAVVCRAGATSIAELTVLGRPSVLVPYPHATGDHQHHNAMALRDAGAARLIVDDALDGHTLVDAAEPLLEDEEVATSMATAARAFGRPDAADNVARLVDDLATGRRSSA